MIIRQAEKEDFEELVPFYVRMNQIINSRTDLYDPDNEVFPSVEMIRDAIESGGQIIGIKDGIIVAAAIVNHQCNDAYMDVDWQIKIGREEFWVLHALRVAPEFEGRGYAKKILRYLIESAQNKGQKAIRLDVLEGYSVEKMYTQLGFQYIDTIEIMYDDIGHPERFRLLEKVL